MVDASFRSFCETCDMVRAQASRTGKLDSIARFLRGLGSDEVAAGARLLAGAGVLPADARAKRALDGDVARVLGASVRPLVAQTLTLRRVHDDLLRIPSMAATQRVRTLQALFGFADPLEKTWLLELLSARVGIDEDLVSSAVTRAAGISGDDAARLRSAHADVGEFAARVLSGQGARTQ